MRLGPDTLATVQNVTFRNMKLVTEEIGPAVEATTITAYHGAALLLEVRSATLPQPTCPCYATILQDTPAARLVEILQQSYLLIPQFSVLC